MRSMRILFITGEYPPMQGGVADYTRELGRALVELGHDVGVLTAVDATKGWVEGAKWLVGHKRELRAERMREYGKVLRSGLR